MDIGKVVNEYQAQFYKYERLTLNFEVILREFNFDMKLIHHAALNARKLLSDD
jgi:hypothetical protein